MSSKRSARVDAFLILLVLYCIGFMAHSVLDAQFAYGFNQSPNNRNVSVDVHVNITGSAPEIVTTYLQDPITLAAGSVRVVSCNFSIRDYNGFADIDTVNATFFSIAQSSLNAVNDNNTHYTNTSCAAIAGQQGGFFSNYTCSFALSYYAVNGTWNCTGYVNDTANLTTNNSGRTNISALFALNVTPQIDYGNVAIGSTSLNQSANVTNLGNRPINVSVRGYGAAFNDGLSFVCDNGNVSVGAQRFSSDITAAYAAKTALTSAYQQVPAFVVAKTVNDSSQINTSYWQLSLSVAESANGLCNGTVVFQAESAG